MGMDVNGAMFTIEYHYNGKWRLSNIKWRNYDACVKFASNSDKACRIMAVDSEDAHHYIQWVMGKNLD